MTDRPLFDAVRRIKGKALTDGDVLVIKAALAAIGYVQPAKPKRITAQVALELICHEAIVLEAYKDSKGIWTWSVGITAATGIDVLAYKDNPQPLSVCLEAYIATLTNKYLPAVERAFAGHELTDEQLAAALSFHYNTGAIETASWVKLWKAGAVGNARASIMAWNKPSEIIGRRTKERDLFFDGRWCSDGKATVYPVKKPSYTPDWRGAKRVDVRAELEGLLA